MDSQHRLCRQCGVELEPLEGHVIPSYLPPTASFPLPSGELGLYCNKCYADATTSVPKSEPPENNLSLELKAKHELILPDKLSHQKTDYPFNENYRINSCERCQKDFNQSFFFCPFCGNSLKLTIIQPDSSIIRRLRAWRLDEARAENVPAYCIFHDATLAELAAKRPKSLEGLKYIRGIGDIKIKKYGSQILAIIMDL